MNEWINIGRWMDGWMNGGIDGRMDDKYMQMNRWMDG